MKVQNTITGRSSGKIGNTVASTQFRQNVMRSKPINPKTGMAVNQINQRLYMAALIPLIRLFKMYLMFVSSKDIGYMSRFNSVMKYALKNAMSMVGSVATINFLNVKIGSGTYYPLMNLVVPDATATDPITVDFDNVANGYAGLNTDIVDGFVYNKTKNVIYPFVATTVSAQTITTAAVDTSVSDVLYYYLFSYAADSDPLGTAAFKPAKTFVSEVKTKTVIA